MHRSGKSSLCDCCSREEKDCSACENERIADALIAGGAILAPCKVGDPVYYVVSGCIDDEGEEFAYIEHGSVHGVSEDKTGIWVFCRYNSGLTMHHKDDDFGKTVFLFEDGAMEALKEVNLEKNN